MTTTKEYEDRVAKSLDEFYAHEIEEDRIRVRQPLKYGWEEGYRCYSPMIDISVGPFSETRGESLSRRYDDLVRFSKEFLDDLLKQFKVNYEDFGEGFFSIDRRTIPSTYESFLANAEHANSNARCFMAIEVELSGNRKHLLGDILNAGISGRIGIVIGCGEKVFKSFLRELEYFAYAVEVKKLEFNSRNIIVLRQDQFESILTDAREKLRNSQRKATEV